MGGAIVEPVPTVPPSSYSAQVADKLRKSFGYHLSLGLLDEDEHFTSTTEVFHRDGIDGILDRRSGRPNLLIRIAAQIVQSHRALPNKLG